MNPKEMTNKDVESKPRDRKIIVTVKSSDLFNLPYPPNERQIDDNTYLSDGEGLESPFGSSNKNFETDIYKGKQMVWEIRAYEPLGADREYVVTLDSVSQNSGADNPYFFTETPPLRASADGKVHGTVANLQIPFSDDNYTINFTITHGKSTRPYPLDPKLRLNQ